MNADNHETDQIVSEDQDVNEKRGFFSQYWPFIFLGGFLCYLILLVIGVIAEIFDIQSILDWWIWTPPKP